MLRLLRAFALGAIGLGASTIAAAQIVTLTLP
jgi:hypothetical protein